jgi:hypothetical protein
MVKPKNIDMKVICIKKAVIRRTDSGEVMELKCVPIVGDLYTVVNEYERSGVAYYNLEEFPPEEGFAQYLFARLDSNIAKE